VAVYSGHTAAARYWRLTEFLRGQLPAWMTLQSLSALFLIAARPGIAQSDVKLSLGLTTDQCSRLVGILGSGYRKEEGLRLVVARQDAADRRQQRLYLTRRGESLIERAERHY
jgi:DNA-binding MarR family transcriptional regulator